jgi:protein TonB
MTMTATSRSGLDPRAALGSLLAHGLLFGAVAAAATLGGVAAPPSERAIEWIEIAIAAPVEAPLAAPIEAPVVTQAASSEPIVEPALVEPLPPVLEPIPDQVAELPEPPPPVAKPAPVPRFKPVARKPVEAPPVSMLAPKPVQAAAPVPDPAPGVAAPAASAAHEVAPQTAAVAAPPATNEIMVTTDARFRARPVAPEYPPRARQMGVEGTTVLRALVGEAGDTLELIVWQGSGMRLLDEAALAAARQWRFEPARRGDRLLTAWVEVPVRFILR